MNELKFKTGDKVKIVKYGSLLWIHKDSEDLKYYTDYPVLQIKDNIVTMDMKSEYIGKIGIVEKGEIVQGREQYALQPINKEDNIKHAWYDAEQLELVSINPNTHE